MKSILITGANGQLGQCLQKISVSYPNFRFCFKSSTDLDISSEKQLHQLFKTKEFDYCINTAAYTNVEEAETDSQKAFKVNADAVRYVAEICKNTDTKLIHISTDYVFDGTSSEAYKETDKVHPINVYGASKLKGEEAIESSMEKYFILRTSWLYSEFGRNFYKTILKKTTEGAELNITTSQLGTPTNANDLALFIMKLINSGSTEYGLYHYSNLGKATWYDFAKAILKYAGKLEKTALYPSGFYKTKAQRPQFSVLSKEKILKTFGFPIPGWEESLERLIEKK